MAMKKAKRSKSLANSGATVNVKVRKEPSKAQVCREKQTRIEILQALAQKTTLTKTQVETVFDELNKLMVGHLRKKGSGEFTIPKTGVKILRVKKKPSKARTMVSPLTGQEVTIAAKPARHAIKVTALKTLKEMVES